VGAGLLLGVQVDAGAATSFGPCRGQQRTRQVAWGPHVSPRSSPAARGRHLGPVPCADVDCPVSGPHLSWRRATAGLGAEYQGVGAVPFLVRGHQGSMRPLRHLRAKDDWVRAWTLRGDWARLSWRVPL